MNKTFQISKYFSISISNDFYDAYVEFKDMPPQHRWFFFSFFGFTVSYAPKDDLSIHLDFLGTHVNFNYDFSPEPEDVQS